MTAEGFERGRLSSDRKVMTAFATVVALLVVSVAYLVAREPVSASHSPANKAVAAGNSLTEIPAGTPDVPILTATMRTSKPTDLIMTVSLECAILTKLLTGPGAATTATVDASIRVWVTRDGNIVPIMSTSEPPQSTPPSGGERDKVTFCEREEGRTVHDGEDNDGTDIIQTFQFTKNANAFTWVQQNAGSGVHEYVVHADIMETGPCARDLTRQTCSDGLIGNRTFIIEPTKMENDARIN